MSILINNNTTVICQGFTEQQGTFHLKQAILKTSEINVFVVNNLEKVIKQAIKVSL